MKHPEDEPSLVRDTKKMVYAIGLICSLIVYNFMQERIMTKPYKSVYAEGGEYYFNNSFFLVFLNRVFASIAAAVWILSQGEGLPSLRPGAPVFKFYLISISNLVATTSQYEALKWITFPTQMLFKCAKLIPVMLMSTLLSRKTYTLIDYGTAVAVGIGCLTFSQSGNIASRIGSVEDSWIGLALMACNIGTDAFMTAFQENLFVGYNLSAQNQMLYVNLCSATIGVFLLAYDNTLMHSIAFLIAHPSILIDVLVLMIGAVSGQFFITSAIKNFGAVFFATIMTIQQVLSVVVSSLVHGTSITQAQFLSCSVVFGALLTKSFSSWFRSKSVETNASHQGSSNGGLQNGQVPQTPGGAAETVQIANGNHSNDVGGQS